MPQKPAQDLAFASQTIRPDAVAAIAAECQRIRDTPSAATTFAARVLDDLDNVVATLAAAAGWAAEAGEELQAQHFSSATRENFSRALEALEAAAEPVLETERFTKKMFVLRRELRSYLEAGESLQSTDRFKDHICILQGTYASYSILEVRLRKQAETLGLSAIARNAEQALKDLPADFARVPRDAETELGQFSRGVPDAMPVGKPLRFRR